MCTLQKRLCVWGCGSDPCHRDSLRSSLLPPCNLRLSSPLARFEQSSCSRVVGSHSVVYHSSDKQPLCFASRLSLRSVLALHSFRYAQSRKAAFACDMCCSFHQRVPGYTIDRLIGEEPHPHLRSELIFCSFRYAQSRRAGFRSMPGSSLKPLVIRKDQRIAPIFHIMVQKTWPIPKFPKYSFHQIFP